MRSIPAAMTWEILHRGRWSILLAIPGAMAIPAMIIMALRHDGLIDWREPSMLLMHVVLVQVCALCCGASLFAWQGRTSRLYAYPIRSSEIVAWKLLPAMVIIALQMVACIATLNLLFDLHWPIFGPALMAAVGFAAVMAVVWLTEKSVGWSLLAFSLVAAALGLWFKSRYGHAISDPTHFWDHVTAGDATTMLAMTAVAYAVSVFAVARNRRGERPLSIGLLDWLYRIFDASPAPTTHLGTPFRAQCWFEWQRNGWAMPGAALFVAAFGTTIWVLFDREALSLFIGFLGGGAVLQLLGCLGGVLFGNVGQSDDNHAMGHFRATRPDLGCRCSPRDSENCCQKRLLGLVDLGVGPRRRLLLHLADRLERRHTPTRSELVALPGHAAWSVDGNGISRLSSPPRWLEVCLPNHSRANRYCGYDYAQFQSFC